MREARERQWSKKSQKRVSLSLLSLMYINALISTINYYIYFLIDNLSVRALACNMRDLSSWTLGLRLVFVLGCKGGLVMGYICKL